MRDGQRKTMSALPHCKTCHSGELVTAQLDMLIDEIEVLRASCRRLEHALSVAAQSAVDADHRANHDELTGVPNRRQLMHVLQNLIETCSRRQGRFAVLFIDLNGFKHINDHFGHEVGDQALKRVAARIVAAVRAADFTARYGGDEFVVLLGAIDSLDSAHKVAAAVSRRIGGRCRIDGRDLQLSASIGLALYPDDADHQSALLRRADADMYHYKAVQQRDSRIRDERDEICTLPPM